MDNTEIRETNAAYISYKKKKHFPNAWIVRYKQQLCHNQYVWHQKHPYWRLFWFVVVLCRLNVRNNILRCPPRDAAAVSIS